MEWLAKRVWQLGIAVVLVVVSMVLMYTAGTEDVNQTLLWVGLVLYFVAMGIPLFSKAYQSREESEGEEAEA